MDKYVYAWFYGKMTVQTPTIDAILREEPKSDLAALLKPISIHPDDAFTAQNLLEYVFPSITRKISTDPEKTAAIKAELLESFLGYISEETEEFVKSLGRPRDILTKTPPTQYLENDFCTWSGFMNLSRRNIYDYLTAEDPDVDITPYFERAKDIVANGLGGLLGKLNKQLSRVADYYRIHSGSDTKQASKYLRQMTGSRLAFSAVEKLAIKSGILKEGEFASYAKQGNLAEIVFSAPDTEDPVTNAYDSLINSLNDSMSDDNNHSQNSGSKSELLKRMHSMLDHIMDLQSLYWSYLLKNQALNAIYVSSVLEQMQDVVNNGAMLIIWSGEM